MRAAKRSAPPNCWRARKPRVWREAAASSPSWRATIEHIPTGARLSSADLTEIDDFIRLRLADERDLAEVSERRA